MQSTNSIPAASEGVAASLEQVLRTYARLAIAVSGGVDSMTLAAFAAHLADADVEMFHAVSPAVPDEATQRVRDYARRFNWRLHVVDAGEFQDENYLANPLNRCYFCKTNLYGVVARHTTRQIASGANLDDLGEYRPGLIAAREHNVCHPFVEARMDKNAVRQLAHSLDLHDLAELPSSPCLSSRLETGIRVQQPLLQLVQQAEQLLRTSLVAMVPRNVRCRVRASAIGIEIDTETLAQISAAQRAQLSDALQQLAQRHGVDKPIEFSAYRVGSAFLHERR